MTANPNPLDTWPNYRPNDPAHQQLQAFLVMDLQRSPEWIEEVLAKVMVVRSQTNKQWQRLGNAYALTLTAEEVQIEDLFDESIQTLSLAEFEAALQVWQSLSRE